MSESEKHDKGKRHDMCIKWKENLILVLNFAERYKIGIDWDIN